MTSHATGSIPPSQQSNPFHTHSPLYGKARPDYPSPAVDLLMGDTLNVPLRVADIGAGTGKLSILLAQRGALVEAVEPSEAMAAQMPPHPHITRHASRAEATGLASDSVEVVTFAQSWHWVDPVAASAEAARICQPGGRLELVWNQLDVSIPWVHRLTRIMRSGDVHRPERAPAVQSPWSTPTLTRYDWAALTTPEELLELGTTRSSYLRQNTAGRQRMQNNLRWYLYEHLNFAAGQPLRLPYMTLVWSARLPDN